MTGGADSSSSAAKRAKVEAENRNELLRKLPEELWSKIVDENVQQNDVVALAMTCRFFREKQEDLGKKVETNLDPWRLVELRKSGEVASHSSGWFRWVCDTFEIRPGFESSWRARVEGAVHEGDLMNYAAFQGSVEILRWLHEEKGWELTLHTGEWAGMGGSIELLEYLGEGGYEFGWKACEGAARGGHLKALKWLRAQEPPCPWSAGTCAAAARIGNLDVLKWARDQDPPCPWEERVCAAAAWKGHLDVLMWARSQDPPCPWNDRTCLCAAKGGHLDVLKWLRDQDPPCPWDYMTCSNAAEGGHLDVLKWLRAQDPPCAWDERTAEAAAREGHLDVLVWLRFQNCPWDASACSAAALGGNFAALRFLRQERCSWNGRTCSSAAKGGHLDVLKWLRSQDPPCPWSAKDCALKAEKAGHDHVVRWIKCNVM